MLDPEYLLRISEGAEDISERLHADIVNRIVERMMLRLGRGEDYLLTPQDRWQIMVLQDAGFLLSDIQEEIRERTKQQEQEVKEAFEEAGIRNLEYDNKIYEAAGLSSLALFASPPLVRIMQRNYEATMGEWYNYTRTTADESQKAFINAMDKAYNLVSTGAVSYTEAFREAIEEIVSNGVEVTYTNTETGRVHKDTIETATLRAVRTGVSQMSGQITLERMKEVGWDIVLTSAHLGARIGDGGENHTNHTWWQGKFFSLSGQDKRFLPFSVCGKGDVQGINGANCRHSFGPGDGKNNPFDNIDNEENRRIRELEERQRLLERRIRKTKREVMGWKAAVDNCEDEKLKFELDMKYQRKAALLQNQNKAYNDFCEKNGLKRRDDRVQIARWDRKQAASARSAAARYKNALDIKKRQDIIKSRVESGEYNLKLSKQQYLKHVEGTKQYEDYLKTRIEKGKTPQSRIAVSEDEIQELLKTKSGTGEPEITITGNITNKEFVYCNEIVGQHYEAGAWVDTNWLKIHYGKKSSHAVPVRGKK